MVRLGRLEVSRVRILHKARPAKARRRAIVNAAGRNEKDVHAGFLRAIRVAQRAFNYDEVRAALARNAPEIAVAAMPWPEFERALEQALMQPIKNAVADGAAAAVRDLRPRIQKKDPPKRPTGFQIGADIAFNLDNPRTQSWLARHAARLVSRVRQETMLAIRRITTEAHTRGLNVGQQADRIATALRRDVGLNQRQAGALARYEAALVEEGLSQRQIDQRVAEYRDRLIDSRARVIARNETLTASNVGQQEVWQQATEQGLLEPGQKRVWIAQPSLNHDNPCPTCKPMNGQVRGMDEPFVSPYDGTTVMQPPAHVACECTSALHFED